jgi:GcrA cell cycle regulator
MQSFSWTPEHFEALREQIVRGRSYGEAVHAINAKFGTAYTRAAALGRGSGWSLSLRRVRTIRQCWCRGDSSASESGNRRG